MLDYMYEMDNTWRLHGVSMDGNVWKDYSPASQEITRDVLRLAQSFQLPELTSRATMWLAKDITTGNVVERLAMCSDFGLEVLHAKIMEQLTLNRQALVEVAHSSQITKHPELMQAMLKQASVQGLDLEESAKKKARKCSE